MALKPKLKTHTKITKVTRFELTDDDLRVALMQLTGQTVPPEARVYVMVPGGGDWSSMALDIDNNIPLVIEWTEVSEAEV